MKEENTKKAKLFSSRKDQEKKELFCKQLPNTDPQKIRREEKSNSQIWHKNKQYRRELKESVSENKEDLVFSNQDRKTKLTMNKDTVRLGSSAQAFMKHQGPGEGKGQGKGERVNASEFAKGKGRNKKNRKGINANYLLNFDYSEHEHQIIHYNQPLYELFILILLCV